MLHYVRQVYQHAGQSWEVYAWQSIRKTYRLDSTYVLNLQCPQIAAALHCRVRCIVIIVCIYIYTCRSSSAHLLIMHSTDWCGYKALTAQPRSSHWNHIFCSNGIAVGPMAFKTLWTVKGLIEMVLSIKYVQYVRVRVHLPIQLYSAS